MCAKQACRVSGHITDPLKQVRQVKNKYSNKKSLSSDQNTGLESKICLKQS